MQSGSAPARPEQVATYPVVECFGPTVQGEGTLAGLPTYFVRFGYCDFRCSWCDSMHSVDPRQVKTRAETLTARAIVDRLEALPSGPEWVTLSGGNPALHELGPLCDELHLLVAVETQGSLWRDWLARVALLTVSPKPPSSGMAGGRHALRLDAFMRRAEQLGPNRVCLKVVVFDEVDLEWATAFFARWGYVGERYLSLGTPRPLGDETIEETRNILGQRYRWLCERVARDSRFADVRLLPQLHVMAWGHALGV